MENQKIEQNWEEIQPNVWKPNKEGDNIEGVLIQKTPKGGKFSSDLYHIENKQGIWAIWGSTILEDRMRFVEIGQEIRIRYKGIVKNAKKQDTKLFAVDKKGGGV